MSKTIGTLLIRLGVDTKRLKKGLFIAERDLKQSGRRLKGIGSSINQNIGIPFTAATIASARFASQVESNFSKIENLVGITGRSLMVFKEDVKALSGEVGKSQKELSQALFTVTSAGLRGAKAMDVLRVSSKLSVIGLGQTEDIARSLTGILESYKNQNLSANQAATILFKTVQVGNLKAEELASALSGVNVLASQMGVKFSELGSIVGIYTRTGKTAAEATTGIEGALSAFLKPAGPAIAAFKKMGTNIDEVRKSIRERGLITTMTELRSEAERLGIDLSAIFGRKEALTFALSITQSSKDVIDAMQGMAGASAEVERAFQKASETSEQKLRKQLVKIQNSAIDLGAIALPVITQLAESISALAERFLMMDKGTRKTVLALGAFVTVGGVTLKVVGSLVVAYSALVGAYRRIVTRATAATTATTAYARAARLAMLATGVGAAITVVGVLAQLSGAWRKAGKSIDKVNEAQARAAGQTRVNEEVLGDLLKVLNKENLTRKEKEKTIKAIRSINPSYFKDIDLENQKTEELNNTIADYISLARKQAEQKILNRSIQETAERIEEIKAGLGEKVKIPIFQSILAGIKDIRNPLGGNVFKGLALDKAMKNELMALENSMKIQFERLREIAGEGGQNIAKELNKPFIGGAAEGGVGQDAGIVKLFEVRKSTYRSQMAEFMNFLGLEREKIDIAKLDPITPLVESLSNSNIEKALEKAKEMAEGMGVIVNDTKDSLGDYGQIIADGFAPLASGAEDFKAFGESVKETVRGVIKALIAESITKLIADTIFKGGLLGLALAPAAAGAGVTLFNTLIPKFQHGGVGSGLALVGEAGPEVVNLGSSSRVFPNQETKRMLSGGNGPMMLSGSVALDASGHQLILNLEGARLTKNRTGVR